MKKLNRKGFIKRGLGLLLGLEFAALSVFSPMAEAKAAESVLQLETKTDIILQDKDESEVVVIPETNELLDDDTAEYQDKEERDPEHFGTQIHQAETDNKEHEEILEIMQASGINPYPEWNDEAMTQHSCTWYAWQQAYDRLGVELPWNLGDGRQWLDNAKNQGYATGTVAQPESIAVFGASSLNSHGHVAYVVSVSGDKMYVNQGGFSGAGNVLGIKDNCEMDATIGSSTYGAGYPELIGFIYLGEESSNEGNCGENVTWKLTGDKWNDGYTLTISGTGAMTDYYNEYDVPWKDDDYNIKRLVIQDGITHIGNHAFEGCYWLKEVTLPEGLISIGKNAFDFYSEPIDVVLPDSVEIVDEEAFYGCRSLKSISLPKNLKSIGRYAFSQCENLESISFPEGLQRIDMFAFAGCEKLKRILIPASVTDIQWGCFLDCPNIESIEVDEKNPVFDSRNDCNAIIRKSNRYLIVGCKNTNIPDDIRGIESFAFEGCRDLQSIILPEGLIHIGDYAFEGCSKIEQVFIPQNVSSIWSGCFRDCSSLKSLIVDKRNKNYNSEDNCNAIIETSTKKLMAACNTSHIPEGVVEIGNSAFYGCTGITTLTIPNSVKLIGDSAFAYCAQLKQINLPEGIETIEVFTFGGCSSLKKIEFPSTLKTIVGWSIEDCTSLESINLPKSLESIGTYAFENDSSLRHVYFSGSETEWKKVKIEESGNESLLNATIHFNSSGIPTNPDTPTEDREQTSEYVSNGTYRIRVLDGQDKPLEGAKVVFKANESSFDPDPSYQEKLTNANGIADFNTGIYTNGTPFVEISKDGYISWDNTDCNWKMSSSRYEERRLYSMSSEGLKLKQAVYSNPNHLLDDAVDSVLGGYDLLRTTKEVMLNSSLKFDLDYAYESFSVNCKAINPEEAGNYALYLEAGEEDILLASSSTGDFSLRTNSLKTAGGCYVLVTPKNGGEAVQTDINLKFVKNTNLSDAKIGEISLGKEIEFTVSEDVPFVGGMKLSCELPMLPYEIKATDEKLYIGFNCNVMEAKDKKEFAEKWKDFKQKLEDAWKIGKTKVGSRSLKQYVEQAKKGKLPGFQKESKPIPCDVTLTGYAEANWSEQKASGKLFIATELELADGSWTTLMWGWIPVTASLSLKVNSEAGASVNFSMATGQFTGKLYFDPEIELKLFGGVGIGDVAAAGAYGSGKLALNFNIISNDGNNGLRKIDLTGEAGLEAYIGPFKYTKPFAYRTWNLYAATDSPNSSLKKTLLGQGAVENMKIEDFHVDDLSYLGYESEWHGQCVVLQESVLRDGKTNGNLHQLSNASASGSAEKIYCLPLLIGMQDRWRYPMESIPRWHF